MKSIESKFGQCAGKAGGQQRGILSKHFDTNSEKCEDPR